MWLLARYCLFVSLSLCLFVFLSVCPVFMSVCHVFMSVWPVCLTCLFDLSVWPVCLTCLFDLSVWPVCLSCLFDLSFFLSYVFIIRYWISVCFSFFFLFFIFNWNCSVWLCPSLCMYNYYLTIFFFPSSIRILCLQSVFLFVSSSYRITAFIACYSIYLPFCLFVNHTFYLSVYLSHRLDAFFVFLSVNLSVCL